MKEIIPFERARRQGGLPDDARAGLADTAGRIAARSQIVWGEHCSECAAPACYAACTFYTPRPDGHCRRFEGGIETIDDVALGRAAAMRIRFRRWGKLEGQGPVRQLDPAAAARAERTAARIEALGGAGLGGHTLQRSLAWRLNARRRTASAGALEGFDSFVVEGALASPGEQGFTVTLLPADHADGGLFQAHLTLTGAWSRTVIDLADIARTFELARDSLIQIEPVGDAQGVDAIFGLVEFVAWKPGAKPSAARAPANCDKRAKVVVWDLDNTVWDGTLAEDGIEGLTLREPVAAVMASLDARGVLQSVASKNQKPEALAALERFGLAGYMLHPQVGWGPKSLAIGRIAEALGLGVDSFVFIDDQTFEREEALSAHPDLTALPDTAVAGLLSLPLFDIPVTEESRRRRELYRVEMARAEIADSYGADAYEAFLRSCDLELTVEPLAPGDLERAFELSQRTNQLNAAGSRFTREELRALIADGAREAWTLRCADRFGDYGLIGLCVWTPAEGRIGDFFMSCRVQRKAVETAFFDWLAARARRAGAPAMSVRWRKTARNGVALEMFETLGFVLERDSEDAGRLVRRLDARIEGADIVRLIERAPGLVEA